MPVHDVARAQSFPTTRELHPARRRRVQRELDVMYPRGSRVRGELGILQAAIVAGPPAQHLHQPAQPDSVAKVSR